MARCSPARGVAGARVEERARAKMLANSWHELVAQFLIDALVIAYAFISAVIARVIMAVAIVGLSQACQPLPVPSGHGWSLLASDGHGRL